MFSKYAIALYAGITFTLIGIWEIPRLVPGKPIPSFWISPIASTQYYEKPWFVYHTLFFYGIYLLLRVITLVSKEYREKLAQHGMDQACHLDFLDLINEYCLGYAPALNPAQFPASFIAQHAARRTRWTLCFWLAVAALYC